MGKPETFPTGLRRSSCSRAADGVLIFRLTAEGHPPRWPFFIALSPLRLIPESCALWDCKCVSISSRLEIAPKPKSRDHTSQESRVRGFSFARVRGDALEVSREQRAKTFRAWLIYRNTAGVRGGGAAVEALPEVRYVPQKKRHLRSDL